MLANTEKHLEQSLDKANGAGIDVFNEMHLDLYRQSLTEKIAGQKEDADRAAEAVEDSRKKAVKARQDRQAIEKIKDKHLDIFRREEAAREQKAVDEMALYSHFRSTE